MKRIPGQWNSSITRVRPFFQALIQQDVTGECWLPKLLSASPSVPRHIIGSMGKILPWVSECRYYSDRVLAKPPYCIKESIPLEKCFEKAVPPPAACLRWLIENPSLDARAINEASSVSCSTKSLRRQLFGDEGCEIRDKVTADALSELERVGGDGSRKKWWAFEGFTEVDCYLETDNLVLLIEGKRTEPLSGSTIWHKERNQLLRNVESAAEIANGKEFGVLLMSEEPIAPPGISDVDGSYPHLPANIRQELLTHYWGCVTWTDACRFTEVSFDQLPKTMAEVADRMRK